MPKEQRPPDNPATLAEWLWRLRCYESRIFVRARKPDGGWGTVALSELRPKEWAEYVAKWLEQGYCPVRMKEEDEL